MSTSALRLCVRVPPCPTATSGRRHYKPAHAPRGGGSAQALDLADLRKVGAAAAQVARAKAALPHAMLLILRLPLPPHWGVNLTSRQDARRPPRAGGSAAAHGSSGGGSRRGCARGRGGGRCRCRGSRRSGRWSRGPRSGRRLRAGRGGAAASTSQGPSTAAAASAAAAAAGGGASASGGTAGARGMAGRLRLRRVASRALHGALHRRQPRRLPAVSVRGLRG